MEPRSKYILECRLCKKRNLENIYDFGFIPIGNNLQNSVKESLDVEKYPLSLIKCFDCNHFQLNFSVDPKLLYATNYTYLTSVGASFRKHLEKFANTILKYTLDTQIIKEIKVLDIGSNDGTALSYFKKKGCNVLGVDPASIPSEIANKNGIKTINNFFSLDLAEGLKKSGYTADIVISHNVLAHGENIEDVFRGINSVLNVGGLLVFEVGYFGDVIKNGIFDTIYHEHLDYHSKKPLIEFLLTNGFSIVNIETNNIQGGTIRFYCKKVDQPSLNKTLNITLDLEEKVFNQKKIDTWAKNIFNNIEEVKKNIKEAVAEKTPVWAYGAPTKATLVANMLGNDAKMIEFVIDDNPLKEQKYIPGTSIPIIMKSKMPIYKKQLIICFAWNFFDDIFTKLKLEKVHGVLLNVQNGKRIEL